MRISTIAFLVLCPILLVAQKKSLQPVTNKQPLTHEVYDNWKEITYRALTPDGSNAAYTVNPQDGDGKVVFHNLKTLRQDSVHRATDISLTWDSRHAVFKIKPQKDVVNELRRQKKKKEDLPKDSLGVFSFAARNTEKIPDVRSYKIPEKAGGWVAYLLEAPKETKGKPEAKADTTQKEKTPPKKVKKNSDENGYTLVLRDLTSKKETLFGYVKDYTFSKNGNGLIFTTTGNDSTLQAGVYWVEPATGTLQYVYQGNSKYKIKGLAFDEQGTQAAFLVDADTTKAQIRYIQLYHWRKGREKAELVANDKSNGIPSDWILNEYYTPNFSKDGTRLFFGSSPKPVVPDTTLLPEEIVNVEVWTWKDDYIYPQQNRRLEADKKRSYLTVLHLAENKIVSLANPAMPSVSLTDEGNASLALAENESPYLVMRTWDVDVFKDVTLVNLKDGSTQVIEKKLKGDAMLSPKANYVVWYSNPDTAWYSYAIASKKKVKLTEALREKFGDEEDDHPYYPSRYGTAGFTANDELFLAYDRYDIWAFDPKGMKPPVNLTKIGRKEKIRFRYVRLDPEERFIDPTKEIILSGFSEATRQSGYYSYSFTNGKLTRLIMSDHRFNNLAKARQAEVFLFTRESFREFPDVWMSDGSFRAPKKLSEANPQMKNYLWGTVEHVRWTSMDNIPLEGLLYKPENFDPSKKYPLMVYFYERYADNIHNHYAPAPIRSSINFALYASNGYLVFVPDVIYKIGYPGESALNCIMPGVTSLISKGFVDEKRIGIQGHSWGGYQIAYMITRTNLFAAAEAGAPVSNMISAYGGVRWESGLSRMFQYEQSQSRLGGTLWDVPMRYIENSPIFFADKVNTPLLMMHNDADGAVPWYQGIEYYMALRRLGKPVWMLNYNGQGHGLTQRQDRTDFAKRMMQFFDHYLKDAPMPDWMKQGVPAIEKGIRKGY